MTTTTSHSADGDLQLPAEGWRLVTDAVMGGVSAGSMRVENRAGRPSICLDGDVSTANNGGFLQIALDLDSRIAEQAAAYDGVSLRVRGNGETYNVHLRTSDLWLPWQSFRAGFVATAEWTGVRLPFSAFEPYRTGAVLRPQGLRRIGVVAIGRDFAAAVCISDVALYRASQ